MILDMAKPNKDDKLNKEHFFVAVRLIQFHQNRQNVENLTLTVPRGVRLDLPYFKGFNDSPPKRKISQCSNRKSVCTYPPKRTNFAPPKRKISQCSNVTNITVQSYMSLSQKCEKMEKEIERLQQQLKNSIDYVRVLEQENDLLREINVSDSSPELQSRHDANNHAGSKSDDSPKPLIDGKYGYCIFTFD